MIDVSPELLSFLKSEYDRCEDQTLDQERENAIDRYNGEPYGDEEDGSSQVVARDTAETVDYMVSSILRTIVSGERIVEFTHNNTEAAHEATETIMYLFMDEQDGYRVVHDWLKSGLLEKNAVAMTYVEPQPAKRQVMQGVSVMALMAAEQQGIEVVEAEQTGGDETNPVFTITAMVEQAPKFCDAAVPNEEFYCSPDARTITEAPMKGRRVRKTLSELVEMGYDRDEVESIAPDGYYNNAVSNARDEDRWSDQGQRQGMARTVWWHEEYVHFDENGDGISELLYVQRSADYKIFAVQELEDEEEHPFEDWCPYPMAHRRVGQSLADKVMDLERINTVLWRQTLNGIYIGNNPSTYVHEDSIGENTIDDLLTVRPGRIVRWKGVNAPAERAGTFDPSVGFSAMEFMDRRRETRTGITRLNMGLDEDTLNDTAKGQAQLIARGEQQEEYIARNFGNAFARLVTKKARLLKRYGKPIPVPIDGQWRQVDPSQWPEDMVARPKLGLGSTRKEQRIIARREILAMQGQAMEAGLGIVTEQNLYNSAKGFINDIGGIGEPSEFFTEPPKGPDGKPLPKPEKPDPEMMKAQAQIQAKQAEIALKQQSMTTQLQLKQAEAQAKIQQAQIEGAQDMQIQAMKAQQDAAIEQYRAQTEAEIAIMQAQMDASLQTQQAEADSRRRDYESGEKTRKYRDGGNLAK